MVNVMAFHKITDDVVSRRIADETHRVQKRVAPSFRTHLIPPDFV
jgi:hypothetical protein